MPASYPKRPQFFSIRFLRLLAKSCAVQELGQGAVWLLTTIAMTEDAKRYTGAVAFFNDQLLPIAGFRSWDALDAARRRAVELGWLHYEAGTRHVAGRYWVTIPDRLEVLNDAPMGEEDPASIRSGADGSLIETGSRESRSGVDPLQTGCRPDADRIVAGWTPEPSSLSPVPIPDPHPDAAAEPQPDPDEQDITTPSVPRSAVPRGPQNNTPAKTTVATTPELTARTLGVWVRWRATDPERQAENLATLTELVRVHGAVAVQAVAERLQREGAPDRKRAPGDKCWVDELLPALLATRPANAPGSTIGANPTEGSPQSEIVRQALRLLAQHGSVEVRKALGWAPTVAPTDAAVRLALERDALAADLVAAYAERRSA